MQIHRRLRHIVVAWGVVLVVLRAGPDVAAAETAGARPSVPASAPTGAGSAPTAADVIAKYASHPFEIRLPPALPPVADRVIHSGSRASARIALTFDACATRTRSGYDEEVIRILVSERVPATLFLGGKWMAEHPDATRQLASLPQFELANHSFLHPHLDQITDERVRQELEWTQIVMYSLTGRRANLMRAPYGQVDARVARLSSELGLTPVQYDLASGDPDPRLTREELVRGVTRRARRGSIVVMHMNGRGWRTAQALPEIIRTLRQKGYEFATVGELIRDMQ